MTFLCHPRLRIAGALALIATTIFVACGVPDYNVPNTSDAAVVSPGTGGKSGSSSGGATSSAGNGGASANATGGQPTQDPFKCSSNSDCSTFPATKVCNTGTNHCVECLPGVTACGSGLYCSETDDKCYVGCAVDGDCASVACDASKCPALTCDTTTHQCQGCKTDEDCGPGTECNSADASANSGECVPGCGTNSECPLNWLCCSVQTTHVCVNPESDVANCSACGTSCVWPNTEEECLNGSCHIDSCTAPYADCDKSPSNGCEVNLHADSNNCGTCGEVCTNGQVCTNAGTCGAASCNQPGMMDCDQNPSNACETNTNSDVNNCGGCANVCSTNHDTPTCTNGTCQLTCGSGWGDCNSNVNDGCETDLTQTTTHCGACGTACTNSHGSTSCANLKCSPVCGAGFGDCDGNPSNGCEATTSTDVNNCGSCGNICNLPNATPACTNGSCTIASCQTNWADCDNNAANGCETNLQTTAAHCGSCSNACNGTNGTASCTTGQCGITCSQGFADCDANVANGCEVNLTSNVDHCGTCSTVCQDQPNGTATCQSSACGISSCTPPYGNCDGNMANGCEANENSDPNNCGGCGNKCNIPNATASCTLGVCGISTCNAGFADCDGNVTNGCEVNLKTDTNNCNACGGKCAPANAVGSCVNGACTVTSCTGNFQNCDANAANGCETDVTSSVNNCGACNTATQPTVCNSTHGTPSCSGGVCNITCAAGFGNCDGNVSNGCEATTTNDPANCGTCGTACLAANGTAACVNSACAISSCSAGFADCDGKYSDGCEAHLTTDAANCGVCSNICNSTNGTASCANSSCSIVCNAGYGNCDALASTGCEINLLTSMQDCGTCGQACAPANATGACSGGACSISTCNTGFANCNALVTDGCEVNLTSDPNHCNTCTTVCSFTNAAAGCNSGVCALGTCNAGFANCDSLAANGCEVNLTSDSNHCNSCSTVCAYTNASATCSNGACAMGTCNSGFANCDGSAGNGCEINTNSDINNCGTCGHVCPALGATPTCTAGVCGTSTTTCTAPFKDCNGLSSDGCEVNSSNDVNNCGNCGTKCSFANAAASCVNSACTMGACTAGFANCDSNPTNGCEVNLKSDVNNCSACNTKCTFANASATCNNGTCTMGACNAGFADCNGNPADGCEVNLNSDVNNCNACNTKCSTAGGTPTCTGGSCGIVCSPGFGDCDGSAVNGCETNLNTPTHCGGCNTVCNSNNGTATCTSGTCGIICNAGFGNCDGSSANGCEVNTNTNPNYCGSCSTVCGSANGTAGCSGGVCSIACNAGFGNCDGNFSNGCESTLASDASNCGSCATACNYANASGVCSASTCQLGTCNTGYGNCDGNAANGCETALTTTANCGTCGDACTNANGTTACTAGACVPTCSTGYMSCDGNAANGCEQNVSTDVNHCGSCTNACSYANATPTCSGGACSMGACAYLFGNCNGSTADGCEKSLAADTSNCGACGAACSTNNATPACSGGACSIVSCSAGYSDCDHSAANGCEINTNTDANNCGACGKVCNNTTCAGGVCQTACIGYSDCVGTGKTITSWTGPGTKTIASATTCYEWQTTSTIAGGNCTSFSGANTMMLNGATESCTTNFGTIPAKVGGGYCFHGYNTFVPNSSAFTTW